MNKVLCFGEALIDFLNTGSQPSDGLSIKQYAQYPGGAPANAAVAVAKLGGNASFVGQVGDDMFGEFLRQALAHYDVNTDYLYKHPTAKTALAFVALDETGEREFSFYRQATADILFNSSQIDPKMFDGARILHTCSNVLTDEAIAKTTGDLLQAAQAAGLTVSFDVNLRHNLWQSGAADKVRVNDCVKLANVLKFSREELEYLTSNEEAYIAELLQGNARLVVVTNDANPIHFFTASEQGVIQAPKVSVVDTTAGGDAFSGGLLYQLAQEGDFHQKLSEPQFASNLVTFASRCGAFAVTKAGAFPALPTLADVTQFTAT